MTTARSSTNPVLRARVETMIRVASPLLDLVLFVGDRVARLLEAEDPAYVPARLPHDGESAPRGLGSVASHARRKPAPAQSTI